MKELRHLFISNCVDLKLPESVVCSFVNQFLLPCGATIVSLQPDGRACCVWYLADFEEDVGAVERLEQELGVKVY